MPSDFDLLRREVIELVHRKRRHGRSLTGAELAENMSSEALLSTSALRTA